MNVESRTHSTGRVTARGSCRCQRRAMTLVEVMVVSTLLAIVAGVAVTLLAAVKRWDVRLRDHGLQSEQTLRLAESIRGDVRLGTNVTLPKEDTLVVDLADGRRVSYEIQPDGC